jgi:hypothetical protein
MLLHALTSGTTQAGAASGGPATEDVRFRVFSLRPMGNLVFRSEPEMHVLPLEFHPTARSPEYRAAAGQRVSFLDAATGIELAAVTLPTETTQVLLVFVPKGSGANSPAECKVFVVDEAPDAAPAGRLAILNLSGLELHGVLNRRRLEVGRGWQDAGPAHGVVRLELQSTLAARDYRAYSERLEVTGNERPLLVLFPPFYPGSLEVQGRLLVE